MNWDGGVFRDRTNYVLVGTFSRLALVGVTGVVGVEGLPTLYLSVSFHLPVSCGGYLREGGYCIGTLGYGW